MIELDDLNFVSRLEYVPIVKAVKAHKESDFDSMTKEQLINVIPSNAVISWNKEKILVEVKRVYNLASVYLNKHEEGLSVFRPGTLCLLNKKDRFLDSIPVYVFNGMAWTGQWIGCNIQKLSLQTLNRNGEQQLYAGRGYHAYTDEQLIYPIPKSDLVMMAESLSVFKNALEKIEPLS